MILNPRNIDLKDQHPDIYKDGRVVTNTEYIKLLGHVGVHIDNSINS